MRIEYCSPTPKNYNEIRLDWKWLGKAGKIIVVLKGKGVVAIPIGYIVPNLAWKFWPHWIKSECVGMLGGGLGATTLSFTWACWTWFKNNYLITPLFDQASNALIWHDFIHFYRTRVRSLVMLVTHSLTHWLTDSCLANLIDVTLACEDAYSKHFEVVTVADVDDENRVGNSLLQIWKLRFGHEA